MFTKLENFCEENLSRQRVCFDDYQYKKQEILEENTNEIFSSF